MIRRRLIDFYAYPNIYALLIDNINKDMQRKFNKVSCLDVLFNWSNSYVPNHVLENSIIVKLLDLSNPRPHYFWQSLYYRELSQIDLIKIDGVIGSRSRTTDRFQAGMIISDITDLTAFNLRKIVRVEDNSLIVRSTQSSSETVITSELWKWRLAKLAEIDHWNKNNELTKSSGSTVPDNQEEIFISNIIGRWIRPKCNLGFGLITPSDYGVVITKDKVMFPKFNKHNPFNITLFRRENDYEVVNVSSVPQDVYEAAIRGYCESTSYNDSVYNKIQKKSLIGHNPAAVTMGVDPVEITYSGPTSTTITLKKKNKKTSAQRLNRSHIKNTPAI